ncbi:cell division cycle protein 27 homolog B-like isoform X2 [Durio zibethinus]|uniref:Cell division cycle protein 27 homolog B-like isoform X2 n=1 Tax=Durio zibethinus TaxID=66656 RepID=A0A6P5ZAK1_DURZI|nr:cell division cycle protein 27 homolog B-like isoform X2 [Durio zibethinus]
MEAILTDCVQNSLRHFMFGNAIFLCERLCAESPTEVNLQLLAACYLQNNQAYSAYCILKGKQTAQSRYLFAISCFQMDLLNEAETALCPAHEPGGEIPNGAAGHYLLGLIYRYTDRTKNAIHHFRLALSIDPLLWAAYEELCVLGAAEDAAVVFGEAAALCIQKQYLHHGIASPNVHTSNEDYNLVSSQNFGSEEVSPRQLKHTQGNNLRDIPGSYRGAAVLSGVAPPPLCRNMQPNGSNLNTVNTDGSPRSVVNSTIQAPRRKFVDEGKFRKISGRLFSDSGPRRSTRLGRDAGANINANISTVAGNGTNGSSKYLGSSKLSSVALRTVTVRKGLSWVNENIEEGIRNEAFDDSRANMASMTSSSFPSGDVRSLDQDGATVPVGGIFFSGSKVISGASEVLGLLRSLGEGYRLSCLYRCQDALDTYLRLPHRHYNTSWVLSQVGKAHFELVDYLEADRAFSLARRVTPYSLEGMDIYSTVLYHLKEDMKLSYLAQELTSTDRLAPQSWCAVGNCYSLQKDHETALKIFKRAVQLNSRFAYAHTLCGHEYVSLADFENGIKSYQNALRIDSRHYNAWYGIGMIFLRQEKFEFSEHHFGMAFQINPRSSVIMSYLGTALHALKKSEDAIKIMNRAILADRKNPLPMYQKANILMSLEKFDDALEVLEELKEHAPRESSVYALMGKIYKRQNMHEKAMLHFGIALDLKPSATDVAIIKAAIEKLHVPDELEDNL